MNLIKVRAWKDLDPYPSVGTSVIFLMLFGSNASNLE